MDLIFQDLSEKKTFEMVFEYDGTIRISINNILIALSDLHSFLKQPSTCDLQLLTYLGYSPACVDQSLTDALDKTRCQALKEMVSDYVPASPVPYPHVWSLIHSFVEPGSMEPGCYQYWETSVLYCLHCQQFAQLKFIEGSGCNEPLLPAQMRPEQLLSKRELITQHEPQWASKDAHIIRNRIKSL